MTYTLQELEALCATATPGPWMWETRSDSGLSHSLLGGNGLAVIFGEHGGDACCDEAADRDFMCAARTAIPELIARIKELDPNYHAAPPQDSVARAQALMREAAEKRAKLEKALADAKMGDLRELNAMGLEAFFDEDGQVKIRQKPRRAATL
jgi:hypothetical protein